MPATRVFRGDSVAVAKVVSITPLSVVAGQIFSVWCNGKTASYSAVAGDGAAEVSAGLAAVIQNSTATEFSEILASATGSVLTLTAVTAGYPFTVTVTSSGNMTVVEATAGAGPTNETHKIQLIGTYTAGNFTLTYNFGAGNVTTGNIAWNATASAVQTAIAALSGVGAGNVVVTGGPGPASAWYVTFVGTFAGTAVTAGTVNGAGLTGSGSVTITETQHGQGLSNEIQGITLAGLANGYYTLTFNGQTTATLPYNAAASTVQSALQALSTIGSGNCLVYGTSSANQPLNYHVVVFTGALAGTSQPLLTISATGPFASGGNPKYAISRFQAGGATSSDEYQVLDLGGATGGSCSITWGTKSTSLSVPLLGGASGLASALSSLTGGTVQAWDHIQPAISWTSANASVYLIRFAGSLANTQQPLMTLNATNLTGVTGFPSITRVNYGGANQNEVQTIAVVAASGTFTLTAGAQTTANIAYNAATGTLQTRLQTDLSATITACTVTGSGTAASPWVVTITTPAKTAIALLTANSSGLGGGGTITETVHGSSGTNEVQTVTLAAGVTGGTFTLSFGGQTTPTLPYNASAAQVQAALRTLSTINTVSVTGSAGGPWTVTWSGAQQWTNWPLLFGDGSLLTGASSNLISLATLTWSAGPRHWDDPTNWTGGRIPDDGDTVILENASVDCLFGLKQRSTFTANAGTSVLTFADAQPCDLHNDQIVSVSNAGGALPTGLAANTGYYIINLNRDAGTFQLSNSSQGTAITISDAGTGTHTVAVRLNSLEQNSGHIGLLGLPIYNEAGYREYRPRFLQIGLKTATPPRQINLGTGFGPGSQRIHIDTGADPVALKLVSAGGQLTPGTPPVLWNGSNASNTLEILNGDLGAAFYSGDVAVLAGGKIRAGSLTLGAGATVNGPIDQTGGKILSNGATINGTCIFS